MGLVICTQAFSQSTYRGEVGDVYDDDADIYVQHPSFFVAFTPPGLDEAAPVPNVQTFTADETWTKPTAPAAAASYSVVEVYLVAGGGGGGSGRRGAAGGGRFGGGGGAGGA